MGIPLAGNGRSPNVQDKPVPSYWDVPCPNMDNASLYGGGCSSHRPGHELPWTSVRRRHRISLRLGVSEVPRPARMDFARDRESVESPRSATSLRQRRPEDIRSIWGATDERFQQQHNTDEYNREYTASRPIVQVMI